MLQFLFCVHVIPSALQKLPNGIAGFTYSNQLHSLQ